MYKVGLHFQALDKWDMMKIKSGKFKQEFAFAALGSDILQLDIVT